MSRFACRDDWGRLPAPLQKAIGKAWRDRCDGVPGSTQAHIAAKRAAVEWFKRHP